MKANLFSFLTIFLLLNITCNYMVNFQTGEEEAIETHLPVIEVEKNISKNCLAKSINRKSTQDVSGPYIDYIVFRHSDTVAVSSVIFHPLIAIHIISSYTKSGARIFQEISSHS